ncbi:MAG: hypothetical protein ABII00_15490 [Elusimicrobiota bacterium]
MSADDFRGQLEETARRVLDSLGQGAPDKPRGGRTAWDLKMELKVSHTVLHMALGMLVERGRVVLRPDQLTHIVEPAPRPHAEAGEARAEAEPASLTETSPRAER